MNIFKRSCCSLVITFVSCAGMNANASVPSGAYWGVFGGGGRSSSSSLNQAGTAFITGGPLNVNANGSSNNPSAGIGGAHLGYEWSGLSKDKSQWHMIPAAEVEGYYLGATFSGQLSNPTTRIPEHTFNDSFPMNTGVFLANVVFILKAGEANKLYPYIGLGIGAAAISISGANSSQLNPAEPGINHFNSNTNASSTAFASQAKAGLHFDLSTHWKLFAEYRFLHLSSTNYTFGSTQYPTHSVTTNWNVHLGSMNYNVGALGVNYIF